VELRESIVTSRRFTMRCMNVSVDCATRYLYKDSGTKRFEELTKARRSLTTPCRNQSLSRDQLIPIAI